MLNSDDLTADCCPVSKGGKGGTMNILCLPWILKVCQSEVLDWKLGKYVETSKDQYIGSDIVLKSLYGDYMLIMESLKTQLRLYFQYLKSDRVR